MMKKIKTVITSLVVAIGLAVPLVATMSPQVHALDPSGSINSGVTAAGGDSTNSDLNLNIKTVVNVMLFALGAIAVIMIVIGGIRYATSGGDSSSITGAKNTILYAVVGLVVAMMAYAIVNWVVGAFAPAPATPPPPAKGKVN